jgi:hypothetical protein
MRFVLTQVLAANLLVRKRFCVADQSTQDGISLVGTAGISD